VRGQVFRERQERDNTMQENKKTKEQLVQDLNNLRKRIVELEKSDVQRMQLREELRDSEARWRSLVENAADLILTIDREGTVLFMNRTPPGLMVQEVIGKSAYNYIEPEHWDMVKTAVAGVFSTGNPDQYEIWARGPHNTLAWYSTRVAPVIKDSVVTAVSVIARDITEQKRAKEALLEAHRKLQATLRAVPDLMFEVDREGRIYDYHAPEHETLYVGPETFLGKTVREVLPESAAGFILHAIADADEQGWHRGTTYSLDLPGGRQDFELSIDVKETTGIMQKRFVALAHNITKRKQAEEERERLILELKEALAKIKTLSGLLPICSWCKKIRDDSGYWQQIEIYIRDHSDAEFTHGICPDCMKKSYGEHKK
jgi:PAS domain S-box-containing protein